MVEVGKKRVVLHAIIKLCLEKNECRNVKTSNEWSLVICFFGLDVKPQRFNLAFLYF